MMKGLDGTPVCPEDHLPVVRSVVADDHGLPTPEIQPGDGRFVGHASGQAQRIDDGFLVAGVVPKPCTAEGWTETGIVNGDDATVSELWLVPKSDLLVLVT